MRLARAWDGKKVRVPDFISKFRPEGTEPHLRIRSHDDRMLAYRRIPGNQLEIYYDSPHSFEVGTEFFLEFEYRRLTTVALVGGSFRIGVSEPSGEVPPTMIIKMPCFYYIEKGWSYEVPVGGSGANHNTNPVPGTIQVPDVPPNAVEIRESALKEGERIGRSDAGTSIASTFSRGRPTFQALLP
ncbi:MAG: hypothetical protein L3K16_09475 [Thermoplasmata archaeon]|nr:hypothetical protein [Thermoplasmata archaeon]